MELIAVQTRTIGPLVRDIAFTLARGEVLALIGPNGAGKSTLIRAILGLVPAQGRILLQGAPLQTLPRAEIARRVAWVPQSLSPPPLALRDFVVLGRLSRHPPFAAPSAADWHAVDTALTRLRLTPLAEAPLPRLSGGERQLALIARALVQDAPLLLMDEPDASLDWGNRRRLARLIHDLAQEGRGLILATHDPETARRCTGLLCLDQGRAEVLPPDALTEARLERLYGA